MLILQSIYDFRVWIGLIQTRASTNQSTRYIYSCYFIISITSVVNYFATVFGENIVRKTYIRGNDRIPY